MLPALFHWRPDGCRACPFGPLFAARLCASGRAACPRGPSRAASELRRPAGPERAAARVARRAARREARARRGRYAEADARPKRAWAGGRGEQKGLPSYGGPFADELLRGNDIRGRAAGIVSRARSGPRSGRTLDTRPAVCNLASLAPQGPPGGPMPRGPSGGRSRRRALYVPGVRAPQPAFERSEWRAPASGERSERDRRRRGSRAVAMRGLPFARCRAPRQRAGRGPGGAGARAPAWAGFSCSGLVLIALCSCAAVADRIAAGLS